MNEEFEQPFICCICDETKEAYNFGEKGHKLITVYGDNYCFDCYSKEKGTPYYTCKECKQSKPLEDDFSDTKDSFDDCICVKCWSSKFCEALQNFDTCLKKLELKAVKNILKTYKDKTIDFELTDKSKNSFVNYILYLDKNKKLRYKISDKY